MAFDTETKMVAPSVWKKIVHVAPAGRSAGGRMICLGTRSVVSGRLSRPGSGTHDAM